MWWGGLGISIDSGKVEVMLVGPILKKLEDYLSLASKERESLPNGLVLVMKGLYAYTMKDKGLTRGYKFGDRE